MKFFSDCEAIVIALPSDGVKNRNPRSSSVSNQVLLCFEVTVIGSNNRASTFRNADKIRDFGV